MTKTTLEVQGMTCPSCIRRVREALRRDGIARVDVRLADGRVDIEHDGQISEAALIAAVRAAGYDVRPGPYTGTIRAGCCGSC